MRFTNRSIAAQFEEELLNYADENDYIGNKLSIRKKIEYLFYCWQPQLAANQIDEMLNILQYGFAEPSTYSHSNKSVKPSLSGSDEGIPFSNSLHLSELKRLNSKTNKFSKHLINNDAKYGSFRF